MMDADVAKPQPPTVFVSWAHTHGTWSPQRTVHWEQTVVAFAQLLRRCGVDVDADVFSYTARGVDWTRFGTTAIASSETVLIVGNEPYWERWEGRNPPTEGAGVAREADALRGLFDADQQAFQRKVIIVLLPGETDAVVPHDLRRIPRYPVHSLTIGGVEALLRFLHTRPKYSRTHLGQPPSLPAAAAHAGESRLPDDLPVDLRDFTGRERELDELDTLLDTPASAMVISAVDGTAGVGKTSLAVHWAHQVRDRFPDGRMHINLQGFAPVPPVQPRRALELLLRGLGVPDADIPAGIDARSQLYRETLAGRRILILLDNALDVNQVRPLLPTSSPSLALITSRSRLTGLAVRDGARLLTLDVLSPIESIALLREILGVARFDEQAASELAELCGHLPLALRIAGVRLLTRSAFRVADAVHELRNETHRIDVLSEDEDDQSTIRNVFSWSYQRLGPAEQRAFRLLGLHRGPSLSEHAVAALTGMTGAGPDPVLATLVSLHLVEQDRPGRNHIHDLLRLYAAELCRADESKHDRRAAIERVLHWYVSSADTADTLLARQQSTKTEPLPPHPQVRPVQFATAEDALAWFDDEYSTVLDIARQAIDEQLYELCWRLPLATWSFFQRRSRWLDWIELQEMGLQAARLAGHDQAEAWILTGLGDVHDDLEHYEEALRCHHEALQIHRRLGNAKGEATAVNNYAVSLDNLERYDEAIEQYLSALAIFRATADRQGEGMVLNNLGTAYLMTGQLTEAESYYRESLDVRRELGDDFGEGMTLHNLGEVKDSLDDLPAAAELFRQSLAVHRAAGHLRGEARALHRLGEVQYRLGEEPVARQNWQMALDILESVGDPDADEVLALLEGRVEPQ